MADKEHVEVIKDSKFNRQRAETPTLRANCTTGFIFTFSGGAAGKSEFHHILSISSLQDGNIQPNDKLDFFHNCMAMTEWDTNDGHNLIGLPRKDVYESADRRPLAAGESPFQLQLPGAANWDAAVGIFGSVPDLPCHQWEHDDYNKEQVKDLKTKLWQPLARERKNCTADGKSIKRELEGRSDAWRTFLVNRGKEEGGCALCWRNRNKPGYAEFWFKPFSMNPVSPKRVIPPPEHIDDRTGTIKQWLETLFEAVK
jgi:hypothetical protein